jgi:putative DNA primase/helicase
MQLLEHVLGKLVGALPGNVLASNAFSTSSLQGKRIVWTREHDSEACLPVEQIKLLTTGETLTTRQLYSREQRFMPTHLLVLLTSLSPENRLMDGVFRERLCLLSLNSPATDSQAAADERQADSALKAALEAEASGILAWLVRGTREWMRLGLAIPASVRQTGSPHLQPQNSVQDFIRQCCVLEAEARTSAHQLYKRYKHWASQQHRTPLSNKQFGHALKQMSEITSQRGKRGAVYAGIRLTKESEEAGEKTP